MFPLLILLVALFSLATAHESAPNTSATLDNDTVLVFFGTRHGNRNPEKFVPGAPRDWGQEGPVELTSFGKRQAFGFGRELRKFVAGLVDENFVPAEARFFSSSANRCQMALQSALAGLYPPQGYASFDAGLQWSPVPYAIDDPMLRMYAVACPESDAAWQPISDDNLPHLVNLTEAKKPLLDYIAAHTGWNASISNAADLADNVINMDLYAAPYPAWITKPNLEGHSAASLRAEILSFAENHQIACAEYAPCRDLMAGVWLQHVISNLQKLQAGQNDLKIIGYASHTEVTLSLMKALHIVRHEITTSAGFLIEVRRSPEAGFQLRLLDHDPNPVDDHVIYQAVYTDDLQKLAKEDGVWVPVDDFIQLIQPKAISDWQSSCGIDLCKQICFLVLGERIKFDLFNCRNEALSIDDLEKYAPCFYLYERITIGAIDATTLDYNNIEESDSLKPLFDIQDKISGPVQYLECSDSTALFNSELQRFLSTLCGVADMAIHWDREIVVEPQAAETLL
ncbi:hypothetical protein QR680_008244 [Steinernema hermaphroditum]|uniref:Histidine acid phosphatase n=1 Tax=Steinernema hermaphroditum TaxID=289476 RepID=A0AA39M7B4_9BILA|nr:hypothetical protein QR680_008244 [Steinernema hermaphroditum]